MKKILSLVLALCLVALCIGAAVADTETKTGSITIGNAAKGETYTIYKLFDATVNADDNDKVAYYGTIPSTMTAYFEYTSEGSNYVQAKDAAWADSAKTKMSDGLKNALDAWAKVQTSNAGTAVADGGPVVFSNLPLGYYVVTTSQGEQAISVDSTNLNPRVNDKNTTTVTADKTVDGTSYSIGDWITYTATFDTTNWIGDEQVKSYTISDTLPEFLSNVEILSLTIKQTGESDVSLTGYAFDSEKKIIIPWVTGENDNSIYKNGAQIVLVYRAKLTATANVNADNTNTVGITPNKDKTGDTPFNEHEEHDAKITTYAAALKKTDGTNALAGAKFAFKGLTVTETAAGIYTVVSYDATSTELGTVMSTDDNGKLYIVGLKENVTLKGEETEAPLGYNKLTDEISVPAQKMTEEIFKSSEDRYYDAKGNLLSSSSSYTTKKTVAKNLDKLDATAVEVVNHAGTELPSTGGIGTTIFYIVGGLLVIGAAVILVARRKAHD